MSKPFLIIGLPRSKTAWLSIVASTQTSICYHEPNADLGSFDALKALWSDDRFAYVGISDSSLVWQLGRILYDIGPRTLIVSRPVSEVKRSFELYMVGSGLNSDCKQYCFEAESELESYKYHPKVLWSEFDELADEENVARAMHWLMPNATFPKMKELMHMNVQVDRDWVIEKAKQPHTNWHTQQVWSGEPEV